MIKKIWPYQLPNMEPETLAKLVFCFENDPERSDGIISGAQDAIGVCVPGLCRHYYNNRFWPEKIETCYDEGILSWLENHLAMIPMEPRMPGCSVVEGKVIDEPHVRALAKAADDCWKAILARDLSSFAAAYQASFEAQVAMFPGMVRPVNGEGFRVQDESRRTKVKGLKTKGIQDSGGAIQEMIDRWAKVPGVLAYKMPGAGGGGYLACVVSDSDSFCKEHAEAIRLTIRRPGM